MTTSAHEPDDEYTQTAFEQLRQQFEKDQEAAARYEPPKGGDIDATLNPSPPAPQPEPTPQAATPTPVPEPPQRPEITPPAQPDKPNFKKAKTVGETFSLIGYLMSVGVGALGQILFLQGFLADRLPGHMPLITALVGAAFVETVMVGTGFTALTARRDGGRWAASFTYSLVACGVAVALQLGHWIPIEPGVAVVFAGGSAAGFLAHTVASHSRIRTYQDKQKQYAKDIEVYERKLDLRYQEDLAAYEKAQETARQERREAAAQAAAKPEPAPQPEPAPIPKEAAPPAPRATQESADTSEITDEQYADMVIEQGIKQSVRGIADGLNVTRYVAGKVHKIVKNRADASAK